jgi:hypothetical protein
MTGHTIATIPALRPDRVSGRLRAQVIMAMYSSAEGGETSTLAGKRIWSVDDPWPSPGGISERLGWGDALHSGAIETSGASALARALVTWNRRVEPVQHQPTPTSATV